MLGNKISHLLLVKAKLLYWWNIPIGFGYKPYQIDNIDEKARSWQPENTMAVDFNEYNRGLSKQGTLTKGKAQYGWPP